MSDVYFFICSSFWCSFCSSNENLFSSGIQIAIRTHIRNEVWPIEEKERVRESSIEKNLILFDCPVWQGRRHQAPAASHLMRLWNKAYVDMVSHLQQIYTHTKNDP